MFADLAVGYMGTQTHTNKIGIFESFWHHQLLTKNIGLQNPNGLQPVIIMVYLCARKVTYFHESRRILKRLEN